MLSSQACFILAGLIAKEHPGLWSTGMLHGMLLHAHLVLIYHQSRTDMLVLQFFMMPIDITNHATTFSLFQVFFLYHPLQGMFPHYPGLTPRNLKDFAAPAAVTLPKPKCTPVHRVCSVCFPCHTKIFGLRGPFFHRRQRA